MQPEDVSIVIPAFNEAEAIGHVVEKLKKALPLTEIIVVNDGSTDQTARVALDVGAKVINHDRNLGYGASLRTGVKETKGNYVLFCDADGQHSIEDVLNLIQSCDGHDMVVGARDSESHIPIMRYPGKVILKGFANMLIGTKIPDVNSGLRIVRKEVLQRYIHLMPNGFSFSTTSTFALLKARFSIKWVPITCQKRIGNSTVRQIKHGPLTLLLMLRLAVLFEPLKVFMTVAAILFLLSLISLGIDLWASPTLGIGDSTVLLGVSTLLVFMFGLLCDQISALRREKYE